MAHDRRKYTGITSPKRCLRMITEEGNPIQAQCNIRVYKAGLCIAHWQAMRVARSVREPVESVTRCNVYKCFKNAAITMEEVPWCIGHFMRWQKSKTKHEHNNLEEATNVGF